MLDLTNLNQRQRMQMQREGTHEWLALARMVPGASPETVSLLARRLARCTHSQTPPAVALAHYEPHVVPPRSMTYIPPDVDGRAQWVERYLLSRASECDLVAAVALITAPDMAWMDFYAGYDAARHRVEKERN